MRVLITSGGTKVPIDTVRDITNMSRGTFGSKIATQFLKAKQSVLFFHAKGSRTPFKYEIDFTNSKGVTYNYWGTPRLVDAEKQAVFCRKHRDQYSEVVFRNYDDYAENLWKLIGSYKPDILILAAAVSDYTVVNTVDGKIRSAENLTINLKPCEKLISRVKESFPDVFLVGFKLLVKSKREDLENAIKQSLESNHCDLVVGNDLADIKSSDHTLLIGKKDCSGIEYYKSDTHDPDYLAQKLTDIILQQVKK